MSGPQVESSLETVAWVGDAPGLVVRWDDDVEAEARRDGLGRRGAAREQREEREIRGGSRDGP